MRLGPVEERFTAVSALRESRQVGIKDSANVLHVFICSNDLKSMDITSILINCVCATAVLHSNSLLGTTYMEAVPFVLVSSYFLLLTLYQFNRNITCYFASVQGNDTMEALKKTFLVS